MIRINNITKYYPSLSGGKKFVYRNFSLDLPTDKDIAVLGMNGVGKSTLIRMLGGIECPEEGSIETDKTISWPLGLGTGIQPSMTGRENTDFVCNCYGVQNLEEAHAYVLSFTELGSDYDETVSGYSSGMRSRLAFAISILFRFDILLLDEITSVGDKRFKKKCKDAINELRALGTRIIFVSHSEKSVRQFCDAGLVLSKGEPMYFDKIDDAINEFNKIAEGN